MGVHFAKSQTTPSIHAGSGAEFGCGPGTTVNKAGSFHELSAFLLGQLLWRRHVISAPPRPAHSAIAMTAQDLIAHATVLAYRLAGYALQNMAEDAALLAMIFC